MTLSSSFLYGIASLQELSNILYEKLGGNSALHKHYSFKTVFKVSANPTNLGRKDLSAVTPYFCYLPGFVVKPKVSFP